MDIFSAAMSLYLLFPIVSERQQRYAELIKKNITSDPAIIEKKLELVKYLDLEKDEYSLENNVFEFQEPAGENNESPSETYMRNVNSLLKMYEFGEEKLWVGDKEGERSSLVSVNGDVVTRNRFDSRFRIIEQIEWKFSASVADSVLQNKRNWLYGDETIHYTEENFLDNSFTEILYNDRKLPQKISLYEVSNKSSENTNVDSDYADSVSDSGLETKKTLSKISYFKYDDENRVLEESDEFYEEKKNSTTGSVKTVLVYSSRKVFSYTERSDTPDLKYYEDDQLRLETFQIDNDSYYETVYFYGRTGVKSRYENGTKVEEKFFQEKN